jgi:glutaredoxin
MTSTSPALTVYGASWCHVTEETRRHLDEMGVPYAYRDTDDDPEASAWVKAQNEGMELKPTLQLGATILRAPALADLDDSLRAAGLLSST